MRQSCRTCTDWRLGDSHGMVLCRTVFETLYTRFEEPPDYLVMDNGCNLHNYILSREPVHFKSMHMYIDRLHFKGHTGCCPAYDTGV